MQNTFLYEGRCYTACPERSYMVPERPRTGNDDRLSMSLRDLSVERLPVVPELESSKRAIMKMVPQKLCAACHYSCLKCAGPNEYDCMACAPDSELTSSSADESFCLSISVPVTENDHLAHINRTKLFFLILLAVLLGIACVIAIGWFFYIKLGKRLSADERKYAYGRIEYDGSNEQIIIEQEILNASSDSELDEVIK